MTKDKVKDDTFFISLAEDDKPYTVPKLLKHAMSALEDIAGNTPVYISNLLLEAPYTDDDRPTLMVSYWNISDKDTRHYIGSEVSQQSDELLKILPDATMSNGLNMVEYRLPRGKDQANTILLIKNFANHLEGEEYEHIYDLIYHNHLDEDGVDRPFVRAYFGLRKK